MCVRLGVGEKGLRGLGLRRLPVTGDKNDKHDVCEVVSVYSYMNRASLRLSMVQLPPNRINYG